MSKAHNVSLFALARRRSDSRLAERLSATDDVVLVLQHGEVTSASHTVRDLFGWEPELCPGRTLSELFGLESYALLDSLQTVAEAAGGHLATHRGLAVEDADGNTLWVDVTMADLRHDSSVGGTVMTIHDVSDRVEMEHRIRQIEHHDPLTETANAAMFDVMLSRSLEQSKYVGVVVVGTPGLASINQSHGVDFGDAVLIEMARRLASVLRAGDHVARITNAQFAMIVHHLDDQDPTGDLGEVTGRVAEVLETAFAVDGASTRVDATVRSGFSVDGETAQALVDRVMSADMATI